MKSKDRVLRALAGERTDVMPIMDTFWPEWLQVWRQEKGIPPPSVHKRVLVRDPSTFGDWDVDAARYYGIDIRIAVPNEGTWPSRSERLPNDGPYERGIDAWGSLVRTRPGAYFIEMEVPAIAPDDRNVDKLQFDPPNLDSRYGEFMDVVNRDSSQQCVFAKVGGPFLRTTLLRGFEQWLLDLAAEPEFACELLNLVADHLTAIGLEALRRGNLYETGIWIFDDMAHNQGPILSPRIFEKLFKPAYARMVSSFKKAGARYVLFHSDGDIRPVLSHLLDVGIDGINPVEYKAGMRLSALRRQYPRLLLLGGLDNAHILPSGTAEEVRCHVKELMNVAQEGRVVLGGHSIGSDIAVERYDLVHELIRPNYVPPLRSAVMAGELV